LPWKIINVPNSYVSVTLAYNWHKITSMFHNEMLFVLLFFIDLNIIRGQHESLLGSHRHREILWMLKTSELSCGTCGWALFKRWIYGSNACKSDAMSPTEFFRVKFEIGLPSSYEKSSLPQEKFGLICLRGDWRARSFWLFFNMSFW
jgi:hypothetical protein